MTKTPEGVPMPMTSDEMLGRIVGLLDELEADLVEIASCFLESEQVGRFYNLYEMAGLHDAARKIDAAFEHSFEPVDWESM